jgi:hypothetical protein
LFLVATLSTRWDWYLTEEPTGKVVWCELSAEPSEGAQSAPQALLPRRMPREQQKHPVEAMRDPDVLRRLRDRLRDLSLARVTKERALQRQRCYWPVDRSVPPMGWIRDRYYSPALLHEGLLSVGWGWVTWAALSRGLSNNGTASGDSGLRTAGLPPPAVRM